MKQNDSGIKLNKKAIKTVKSRTKNKKFKAQRDKTKYKTNFKAHEQTLVCKDVFQEAFQTETVI